MVVVPDGHWFPATKLHIHRIQTRVVNLIIHFDPLNVELVGKYVECFGLPVSIL